MRMVLLQKRGPVNYVQYEKAEWEKEAGEFIDVECGLPSIAESGVLRKGRAMFRALENRQNGHEYERKAFRASSFSSSPTL